jgi:hypothetical protein
MKNIAAVTAGLLLLLCPLTSPAQDGIDPEALIKRILAVEAQQYNQIKDIVFDAEYIIREKDGSIKERFIKKISIKYRSDTALFHEAYLEYYKKGELQKDKDCQKQADERKKKKIKRKGKDISYRNIKPFMPEHRTEYEISYEGVATEKIEGYACHHFKARALEPSGQNINGDYYFEAESFHLVKLDFSPSKLVKSLMFKLKQLNITLLYAPTDDGIWLPKQIDIRGKGKAMFFIGVNFASTEFYRNPTINGGIDDLLFERSDDKK